MTNLLGILLTGATGLVTAVGAAVALYLRAQAVAGRPVRLLRRHIDWLEDKRPRDFTGAEQEKALVELMPPTLRSETYDVVAKDGDKT